MKKGRKGKNDETPTGSLPARRTLRSGTTKSPAVTGTPGSRRSTRQRTETIPLSVLQLHDESSEDGSTPPPDRATTQKRKAVTNRKQDKVSIEASEIEEIILGESSENTHSEQEEIPEGSPKTRRRNHVAKEEKKGSAGTPEQGGLRKSTRTPKPREKLIPDVSRLSSKSYLSDTAIKKTPVSKLALADVKDKTTLRKSPRVQPKPTENGKSVSEDQKSEEEKTESPTPPKKKKTQAVSTTAVTPAKGEVPVSTPRSTRKRPGATVDTGTGEIMTPKSRNTPLATDTLPLRNKPKDTPVQGKKLEWKFNVYGIPKCPLPCRESQFEEIWKFLFDNVTEKNSGCMYVSGVPGTGKTVIVQAVVDTMQKLGEDKKKEFSFKYLYINGLTLASPDKIWKRMFKALGLVSKSSGISSKEALKRLDSYFESHQRIPVVLVVDELDQILDKQQSILYQLLEWSSHAKNMFSFLAIFNTMSLPEHGLAMRNNSRMGFKRAVFPPYSYDELQTIVLAMLNTYKTTQLGSECVALMSRKVAAISGDARRALEIARRTLEIVESGSHTGMQAVSYAFKEIFSSAKIETIKYTSLLEQMILKTVCDEIRCNGVEEVLTAKVVDGVITKGVYEGVKCHKDDILKAMIRLAVMRLVIVEDNRPSVHKRLLLKVPVEDVNFALGNADNVQMDT